jgi:DNA-binding HxlR family transcriptional regulator
MNVATHGEGSICQHFQRAAELIAQRWMPQVIHAMRPGARRYSDLKTSIPKISDAILSERLKALEAAKIVVRTVEPTTPVRVSYRLTPRGRELADVLGELQVWAERWATRSAPAKV